MKAGIIVILHDRTQEAYAGALAAALSPLSAVPMRLAEAGERSAQIGAGALGVVICGRETDGAAVLRAVSHAPANLLICCLGDTRAPTAMAGRQVVRLKGEAAVDVAVLQPAIAGVQVRLEDQSARQQAAHTPRTGGGPRGAAPRAVRKQNLAVRSAFGLAATMAVVGVVAPAISARAVAHGGAENDADATVSAAQTTAAASAELPLAEVAAATSPPQAQHALDQWLLADAPPVTSSHDDLAAAAPAPTTGVLDHFVEAATIAAPTPADTDGGTAEAPADDSRPKVETPAKPERAADGAAPSEVKQDDAAVRPIK